MYKFRITFKDGTSEEVNAETAKYSLKDDKTLACVDLYDEDGWVATYSGDSVRSYRLIKEGD